MRVYSHSYWLVIFWTTNSSRVLAREGWQTFENSWKKTQYLMNTLYTYNFRYLLVWSRKVVCLNECAYEYDWDRNNSEKAGHDTTLAQKDVHTELGLKKRDILHWTYLLGWKEFGPENKGRFKNISGKLCTGRSEIIARSVMHKAI